MLIRPTQPPRSVFWVCVAVVVCGVVLAFAGALRTGVSWDEPAHVTRLANFLSTGEYTVPWKAPELAEKQDRYTYAPVGMLLIHGLELVVTGADEVARTAQAYAVRHVGVVLIGLVGTAAVGWICRLLIGTWRWAVVGMAVLMAMPVWTGSLMFNIKDVPVASGLTLVSLGLILSADPGRRSRWWLDGVLLASGVVLALGTRPGVWSLVLAQACLWALVVGRSVPWQRIASVVAALCTAVVTLSMVYPYAFSGMWWWKSAMSADDFRQTDTHWWYLVLHAVSETPVMLLAMWGIGVWLAWTYAVRFRHADPHGAVSISVVATQALLLPLLAMVAGSQLYNGLRQVLFVVPAGSVLATVGLAWVVRRLTAQGRAARFAGAVVAAVLVPVMIEQSALFPYQYSWINRVADVSGVEPSPDYWRVSFRELIRQAPQDGVVYCSPRMVDQTARPAGRGDVKGDCRWDQSGPLYPYWSGPNQDDLPGGLFYGFIQGAIGLPENCARLGSVQRTWLFRTVTYSTIGLCRRT